MPFAGSTHGTSAEHPVVAGTDQELDRLGGANLDTITDKLSMLGAYFGSSD